MRTNELFLELQLPFLRSLPFGTRSKLASAHFEHLNLRTYYQLTRAKEHGHTLP